MKTLLKIIFFGVLTVLLSIAASAKDPVKLESAGSKNKDLVMFRADRTMIGATVEILHANGGLIAEQILSRRKVLIDFAPMKSGLYTIRITKDGEVQEIIYEKK